VCTDWCINKGCICSAVQGNPASNNAADSESDADADEAGKSAAGTVIDKCDGG